ncbi:hypothetical protein J4457_01840 [Candidatus Woesearchaeota archaeon]|nr:hypothetical protein [Candidatus Woesearchaeota archaeon]
MQNLDHQTRLTKGQILTRPIIEMLGSPKEHIEDTMRAFLKKLEQSDVFTIVKKDLAPAQQQGKLWSIFAELEIWFKDFSTLIDFCFAAMPSSIEILEPTDFNINAGELTGMLNQLQARVHEADMVVKNVRLESKALDANSVTIFRNFIRFLLLSGPKTLEEVSAPTGIIPDQVRPFLDRLIEAEVIELKDDGKYYLVPKHERRTV